jgi:hypothetical protein
MSVLFIGAENQNKHRKSTTSIYHWETASNKAVGILCTPWHRKGSRVKSET